MCIAPHVLQDTRKVDQSWWRFQTIPSSAQMRPIINIVCVYTPFARHTIPYLTKSNWHDPLADQDPRLAFGSFSPQAHKFKTQPNGKGITNQRQASHCDADPFSHSTQQIHQSIKMIFSVLLSFSLLFSSTNAQGLRGDRPGDKISGGAPKGPGSGPRGVPPFAKGFLDEFKDILDDFFVNSTCVNPTDAPACLAPPDRPDSIPDGPPESIDDLPQPVDGVWVCRSFYSPLTGDLQRTQTACINPSRGLDSDACGCCDGACPVTCECACETDIGEDGVWVEITKKNDEIATKCVPTGLAPSITARDRAQCVTTCPV